jgi:nickel-dependent lactate racemase
MVFRHVDFGLDASVELTLPADVVIADCATPRRSALDDVTAAVADSLATPLDFPPVAEATVPGDRIVLAVDQVVPQAAAVVAGVVHTLVDAGASPASVTIVQSTCDGTGDDPPLISRLRPGVRAEVQLVTHDPCDRSMLTYVAASREGKPIYLNRLIGDADFLVPIGCMRSEDSLGYLGIAGGLFPVFADRDTQQRFWAPSCA